METLTGSCDSQGLFTARLTYATNRIIPSLLTFTPSNELVIDVENVEVRGPVWQQCMAFNDDMTPKDNAWQTCTEGEAIRDTLNGWETRQVYITVQPTESNINKIDMTDIPLSPSDTYYKKLGKRMMADAQPIKEVQPLEGMKSILQIAQELSPKGGVFTLELTLKIAEAYHAQFATEAGGGADDVLNSYHPIRHDNELKTDLWPTCTVLMAMQEFAALTAPSNNSSSEMVERSKVVELINQYATDMMPADLIDALINQILTINKG